MNNEVKEVMAHIIKVVDVGNGELALEFPDEVMTSLNLSVGDDILFIEDDNCWRLFKEHKDT